MKQIVINNVECLTLPEVAALAEISVEALRKRIQRGQVDLRPHSIVGKQHLYAKRQVWAALRSTGGDS